LLTVAGCLLLFCSQGITSALSSAASLPAPGADAAAAAADVPKSKAAGTGAAAAAAGAHNTPLLVLYGSNMGASESVLALVSAAGCLILLLAWQPCPCFCPTSSTHTQFELFTQVSFAATHARMHQPFRAFSPPFLASPRPNPTHAGTCEELAGTVASQATAAGFKVRVANLDSCVRAAKGGGAAEVLPKEGAVLIVSSTYNGTPPDNASAFAKWLDEQKEGELRDVEPACTARALFVARLSVLGDFVLG
jgi:hypothetical protein